MSAAELESWVRFLGFVACISGAAIAWCRLAPPGQRPHVYRRARAELALQYRTARSDLLALRLWWRRGRRPARALSYHDEPAWIAHVTEALDVFPDELEPLAAVHWLPTHRRPRRRAHRVERCVTR